MRRQISMSREKLESATSWTELTSSSGSKRRRRIKRADTTRSLRCSRKQGYLMLCGLVAGAIVMLSSLVEGGQQQQQYPQVAVSRQSQPVDPSLQGGGAKHEQVAVSTNSQQENQHHMPPMNLIPVDQPLINGEPALTDHTGHILAARSKNGPQNREMLNSQALDPVSPTLFSDSNHYPLTNNPSSSVSEDSSPESLGEQVQQYSSLSQPLSEDNGSELSSLMDKQQQVELADIYRQQQRLMDEPIKFQQQQQQQQQQVQFERRFGLLKKGHYGAPSMMSANYGNSAAYLSGNSDCERCFASMNQQTSGELQQIEPVPIQQLPVPVPVIPGPQLSSQQTFGPLKNKLFMKFPFFMKPISLGGGDTLAGGPHETQYTWHHTHHYQPVPRPAGPQASISSALFLRPAAYNCIQATPPLLGGPTSQEVALGVGTKGGQQSVGKQYAHQQATYSGSQY